MIWPAALYLPKRWRMSRSSCRNSWRLLFGIEGQGAREIIISADGRQFAASGGEEGSLDVVVPFDGVEDANGTLRFDETVAERADQRSRRSRAAGRLNQAVRCFPPHRSSRRARRRRCLRACLWPISVYPSSRVIDRRASSAGSRRGVHRRCRDRRTRSSSVSVRRPRPRFRALCCAPDEPGQRRPL